MISQLKERKKEKEMYPRVLKKPTV